MAITLDDFLEFTGNYPDLAQDFFDEYILEIIYDLECNDYFGTEGFNKRFA